MLSVLIVTPDRVGAVASVTQASEPETGAPPETIIEPAPAAADDAAIAQRLKGIFQEIGGLENVAVAVDEGVVSLSGSIPDETSANRAEAIAQRVSGVVTVEVDFERDLSVGSNVTPFVEEIGDSFGGFLAALPLVAIALILAFVIALVGHLFASLMGFWKRVTPNIFLAELVATSVRVVFFALGLFVALDILGATAVLGAVLGGAGVIGLAVGFALRDTVDNYVSSIMLSIRQPFRANDHVLIGDREGRVIRLTSRATILMTLDGNHLRIPNATVFKAEILNFSRNDERRFTFKLGVDADDDPAAAIAVGLKALNAEPFILDQTEATAEIEEVGDSNIIIAFHGWIDQRESDFYKARGAAIRVVKNILEASGFALPEPIYRLRFDGSNPMDARDVEAKQPSTRQARRKANTDTSADVDTSRERHVDQLVEVERASESDADLLDEAQPIE
ncbi:MAG: mechanosensitive ion channel domain-containing protein [Erythrobacter sp.]